MRPSCILEVVRREDIVAFARRSRRRVDESRSEYWAAFNRTGDADRAFALADTLRRHVLMLRPDWPTAEDRQADLETHLRLCDAFHRVHIPDVR
jgi:hypothetical protein